jgi:hypothetical protein
MIDPFSSRCKRIRRPVPRTQSTTYLAGTGCTFSSVFVIGRFFGECDPRSTVVKYCSRVTFQEMCRLEKTLSFPLEMSCSSTAMALKNGVRCLQLPFRSPHKAVRRYDASPLHTSKQKLGVTMQASCHQTMARSGHAPKPSPNTFQSFHEACHMSLAISSQHRPTHLQLARRR